MISVIICTYNPKHIYISRALSALRNQTLALDNWDLLIIDNNSTIPVQQNIDISWHPNAKVILETKQGLTPSRIRGIKEARFEILIFVDDDNILECDYLENSLNISIEFPKIGVWGGDIVGEFEELPAKWTDQYWYYLAIRKVEKDYWSNDVSSSRSEPCGAGMCLRKDVAKYYCHKLENDILRNSLDRSANNLISGGDTDIVLTALQLDYGMGVFKKIRLKHIIPQNSLTEDYLLKLMEGMKYSHLVLNFIWTRQNAVPIRNLKWWSKHLFNLIRFKGRDYKFYLAKINGEKKADKFIKLQMK